MDSTSTHDIDPAENSNRNSTFHVVDQDQQQRPPPTTTTTTTTTSYSSTASASQGVGGAAEEPSSHNNNAAGAAASTQEQQQQKHKKRHRKPKTVHVDVSDSDTHNRNRPHQQQQQHGHQRRPSQGGEVTGSEGSQMSRPNSNAGDDLYTSNNNNNNGTGNINPEAYGVELEGILVSQPPENGEAGDEEGDREDEPIREEGSDVLDAISGGHSSHSSSTLSSGSTSHAWSDIDKSETTLGFWRIQFGIAQKLCFHIMQYSPFTLYMTILVVLELAQLVTFPLRLVLIPPTEEIAVYSSSSYESLLSSSSGVSGSDNSSASSVASFTSKRPDSAAVWVWRIISCIRAPPLAVWVSFTAHIAVTYILFIFVVLLAAAMVLEFFIMYRGSAVPHLKVMPFFHYATSLLRVLMLPMMFFFLTNLKCEELYYISAGTRVECDTDLQLFVTSLIGLVLTVLLSLIHTLYLVHVIPSASFYAVSHVRVSLCLFLCKLGLATLEFGLLSVQALVYTIFVTIMLFAVLFMQFWFMPFYKKLCNNITVVGLGIAAGCSVAMIASSVHVNILISGSLCCLSPFVGIGMLFLSMLRTRSYEKYIRGVKSLDLFYVKHPFQLDLSLRYMYNGKSVTPEEAQLAEQLIAKARAQISSSPFVHLCSAILLLDVFDDLHGASMQARTAKRLKPFPDISYICSTVIQTSMQRTLEGDTRGELESRISQVNKNIKVATAYANRFWNYILRAHSSAAVDSVFKIVRSFGEYQNKVEREFDNLMHAYPNNYKVVRGYALFLKEVKNDETNAELAFLHADELEDQASKKASRTAKPEIRFENMQEFPSNEVQYARNSDADDNRSEVSSISGSATQMGSPLGDVRSLRKKIENYRLGVMNQLHLSIVFTIFVMFLSIILEYALSRITFATFQARLVEMNSTVTCKDYSQTAVFYARSLELDFMNKDLASAESKLALIDSQTVAFVSLFNDMFIDSQLSSEISHFWSLPQVDVQIFLREDYFHYSNGHTSINSLPLWDAGSAFVNNLRDLATVRDIFLSQNLTDFRCTAPFRFVMDNGPTVIVSALRDLGGVYSDLSADDGKQILISLCIIFPLTFVVACIMFFAVFFPTMIKVSKDRKTVLNLFLEVPKSTVHNAVGSGSDDDRDSLSDVGDTASASVVKQTYVAFFVTIAIFLILSAAIFTCVMIYTTNYRYAAYEIDASGTRLNLATQLILWAQEAIVDDPSSYTRNESLTQWESLYNKFSTFDSALKYGNDSMHITSRITTDPVLTNLWLYEPCPAAVNLSQCQGLSSLQEIYLKDLLLLVNSPDSLLSDKSPYFQEAVTILNPLREWLVLDTIMLGNNALEELDQTKHQITIIFWVTLPCVLFLYLLLRYQIETIAMETEKMFKMFLFLPLPELIKIPNLKQFIETGRSYERRSEKTFKDQKQQTKSILDACGDAVIVCNEDRAIEIFNPAAEKLTGFTAEEVLRQDVTDCIIPNGVVHNTGLIRELFSSDTDKKFNSEVTIQTKTKEQFTALMSVSHTSFYNRNCVTLFIRDISEMKQRQDALIHQQHRAEQLLLNILPKTVAEELNSQQSEGDGNKKNYLIAHHFDEVTILFADIVGFTSMSSSMKPEELVLMLNSVFTLWDHLCDSFGVEKIKTIGDCFMAVSGAPVPFPEHADVMMDFAISMLDSLEMFNSTVNNKLSIRIGMNTGSVVAGVIGWKKIAWDIWGDCVNVASRMEHTGFPGHIQISESTYEKLKGKYPFESRGKVNIAGKGEMPTWLLKPTPSDKPRVVHKGPTACKEGATSTEPSSISNNTPNATMPQSFSVLSMASTISRDVTVEELLGM